MFEGQFFKCLRSVATAAACAAALIASGAAARSATGPEAIPDLSNADLSWVKVGDDFIAPASGAGPVTFDKAHPYQPNNDKGLQVTYRVADLTNPILQPWARERLRKVNERSLSGKVVAIPKERCWPVGVPAFLLLPATPVYFLQTPKEVLMVWMQDHQVRRVYLDVPHAANPKPSWFGESVGHYEGDTLVVDTIGITTATYVDNYQTPHTEQLHVVERFRAIDDGKVLEVNVHVEDPGAFTTPWTAVQRWRRVENAPILPVQCNENNGDFFNHGLVPLPEAARPDF